MPGSNNNVIDVNVHLGAWPFGDFALDSPKSISVHLKKNGINRAFCASLEATFRPDPAVCNEKLLRAIKGFKNLRPVAVVNPLLANWPWITSDTRFPACKLIPNYHNYRLGDERVQPALATLEKRGDPLFVQIRFDDERSHYELLKVPGVSVADIREAARRYPNMVFVILGGYYPEVAELAREKNVYPDIAFAENLDTLGRLVKEVPAEKILFGSQTPFLYTEAALGKLQNNSLSAAERNLIGSENAERIL